MRAKAAVADSRTLFISSADPARAAPEGALELGVLFRGGGLPAWLVEHVDAPVASGILRVGGDWCRMDAAPGADNNRFIAGTGDLRRGFARPVERDLARGGTGRGQTW